MDFGLNPYNKGRPLKEFKQESRTMNEIFCKGQRQGGGWIGKRGSGNREASQAGSALFRRGNDADLALEASETWRTRVGLRC